jgi:hypothetical protein
MALTEEAPKRAIVRMKTIVILSEAKNLAFSEG